jgi:hypothetical protein
VQAQSGRFTLPASAEVVRRRPIRRLVEAWREREHLYARYADFLDTIAPSGLRPVQLGDFAAAGPGVLGLRHDIDDRLESALVFARLEAERGVRSTYFALHTAPYYAHDDLIPALRELQDLGHEVGFHNDLVTLQVVGGGDPRAYLAAELERLRGHGIAVVGTAAHGAYWCHRLGYKNEYFFRDVDGEQPGFPNTERVGDVALQKGTLAEFGLAYDASQLETTHYWSDSWVDPEGHRWHPRHVELASLAPGARAIVLVHSCHWDASVAAKLGRTAARLARRAISPRR